MKRFLRRIVWVVVGVLMSANGFAEFVIEPVDGKRAEELGMVFKTQQSGPKHYFVEFRFKATGDLKSFKDPKSHGRIELELNDGEERVLSTALHQTRYEDSGEVIVQFVVNRDRVGDFTLSAVSGNREMVAYELKLGEFVKGVTP